MIPSIGFGTFRLKKDDIDIALPHAIANGYNHIDTALAYNNQEFIANALGKNGIDRDKLWLTSKVGLKPKKNSKKSTLTIKQSIEKCLQDLNTKFIDLVLIHSPTDQKEDINTWNTLEEYHKQGYIKHIGVSNFKEDELQNILDNCVIKPYTNQIELSPFFVRNDLVKFCKDNNIIVTGHSSLVKGEKFDDKTICKLADEYKTSPAQILLQWSKQNDYVVLPRSSQKNHIVENISTDFLICDNDMFQLNNLDCRYATHPQYV